MFSLNKLGLASIFAGAVLAQQPGTQKQNFFPPLQSQECSAVNKCVSKNTHIVSDMNWRWRHNKGGYASCDTICSDDYRCSNECEVEGME